MPNIILPLLFVIDIWYSIHKMEICLARQTAALILFLYYASAHNSSFKAFNIYVFSLTINACIIELLGDDSERQFSTARKSKTVTFSNCKSHINDDFRLQNVSVRKVLRLDAIYSVTELRWRLTLA